MASSAPPDQRVLVTIPISHFCEKARWALERAGLDYEERRHVQGIHVLAVKRAGGGRTAPVLRTGDGVFSESCDILAYCDRFVAPERALYPADAPEVADLERRFDKVLGPEARRWMYQQALDLPDLFTSFNLTGVPVWEARLFPILMPIANVGIKRYLDVSERTAAIAKTRVDVEFDAVAERLSDGRRYLTGDRFTAADLTFAALSAAAITPPDYGVPLPQPEQMPSELAAQFQAWREHPAGQFALRLFREERRG